MANEMRLIDANAFRDWLSKQKRIGKNLVTMMLDETPTVDAVPVVHGRWISVEDSLFPGTKEKCSLCGVHKGAGYVYHYCPNCGAKMDGGKNDER